MTRVTVISDGKKSWVQSNTTAVCLGKRVFWAEGAGDGGRVWSKAVKTGCSFLPELVVKSVLHWNSQ